MKDLFQIEKDLDWIFRPSIAGYYSINGSKPIYLKHGEVKMSNNVIIPSSDADKKKIKDALFEISASMTRMEAEKSLIKEILSNIEEEVEIPKKFMSKMAKVYHKQNYSSELADHEDFTTLYETITGETE